MLMSKAEYAKYKGVSRQTVYDWIEKGEVIMSGKKIDVEATEQRNSPPAQGKDTISEMWPERTLEMTWGEFWKAVKARGGKIRASNGRGHTAACAGCSRGIRLGSALS